MSKHLKDSLHFLLILASDKTESSISQKKNLIKNSSLKQRVALRECFMNLISNNIPLSDLQKQKLFKYFKIIENIARRKVSSSYLVKHFQVIILVLTFIKPILLTKI